MKMSWVFADQINHFVIKSQDSLSISIENRFVRVTAGADPGGAPDHDRPKTAILGPQFCRILVLGPHFWWSGGGLGLWGPPWICPCIG